MIKTHLVGFVAFCATRGFENMQVYNNIYISAWFNVLSKLFKLKALFQPLN